MVLRELMEIAQAIPPVEEVERRRGRVTVVQALANRAGEVDGDPR